MGLLSTIQQELVGQCRDKGRKEIVPVGIAAFDLTVDSSEINMLLLVMVIAA